MSESVKDLIRALDRANINTETKRDIMEKLGYKLETKDIPLSQIIVVCDGCGHKETMDKTKDKCDKCGMRYEDMKSW